MTNTAGRTWKDYKSNTETAQELNTVGYDTTNDATTNECYNERMLQRKMLQRTNATTNSFHQ